MDSRAIKKAKILELGTLTSHYNQKEVGIQKGAASFIYKSQLPKPSLQCFKARGQ